MDAHAKAHLHESPWVVTGPLILLAIPSIVAGFLYVGPLLHEGWFGNSIVVLPGHQHAEEFGGAMGLIIHGLANPPVWLGIAGLAVAYYCYMVNPGVPDRIRERFSGLYGILERKYGFDDFNEKVFAGGGRAAGRALWKVGDAALIDGVMVNGTANGIGFISTIVRTVQTGFLYHYAFAMIIGLLVLLSWFVLA